VEEAIGRQTAERYERALARLRPQDREAIVARVELGCTYEELAVALGKPSADAARKAAQQALVRLAAEMKHERG
jgi:RNA polymerase sigma-70 factor (ECF subfamily)